MEAVEGFQETQSRADQTRNEPGFGAHDGLEQQGAVECLSHPWCPARLTQLDRTSEIGARPKHLTVPNRCVRTRTHGGVGGRSREAASYPE